MGTGTLYGRVGMAAGFGVNVEIAPERADRPTECLNNLPGGEGMTAAKLLVALDVSFRARLFGLLSEGFEPTRAEWLSSAAYLGRHIEVNGLSGEMAGLAEDGALICPLNTSDAAEE